MKKGVRSEWFQVCGMGYFDDVPDLARPIQMFSPWWQQTGGAVLGVYEGGNQLGGPQAVTSRENTSGTLETTFDYYFWLASATVKTVESDWADLRQSPYIEKTTVAHGEALWTTTSSLMLVESTPRTRG